MDVDKRNEELDETIIQTCKWIQKKLQISDKSIRDEKVPEMMSALAELVSARNERGERSCIIHQSGSFQETAKGESTSEA